MIAEETTRIDEVNCSNSISMSWYWIFHFCRWWGVTLAQCLDTISITTQTTSGIFPPSPQKNSPRSDGGRKGLKFCPSSSHWLKESNLSLPTDTDSTRRCPSQAGGEGKGRLGVLRLLMHCNGALGELVEEVSLLVEETLHLSRSRNGLAVINALHAQLLHLHLATLDLVNLIISKCGPV